jgi:hypothetical protein
MQKPTLFTIRGQDLPLSGQALIGLMQEVLGKGRPFRFRAKGWSMSPLIRDRDVITITPIPQKTPGVGEIVAFIHPVFQKLVVHRVVGRKGASWLILGDNLEGATDGWIEARDILGRLTRVEREGQEVRMGLGPERILIAWLSRTGLLSFFRHWTGPLVGIFKKKTAS